MNLSLGALSLFFTISLSAATIPIAPRDVVDDSFTVSGRPAVSAAANGNTFIVAWQDDAMRYFDGTASLNVRTFDANGAPEQQLPVKIAGQLSPAVTWSGTDWVVGSTNYISPFESFAFVRLLATRVDEHAKQSSDPIELASTRLGTRGSAGAATNGHDLFLGTFGDAVITDRDLATTRHLAQAARPLAAAGSTFLGQTPGGVVVMTSDGTVVQNIATSNILAGATDGNGYAIVYALNGEVDALITTLDGTITNRITLQTNIFARSVQVIRRGASYLAAWSDAQSFCSESFDTNSAGVARCQAMPAQALQSFALADGGTRTMLAWSVADEQRDHVFTTFFPSNALPDITTGREATTMLRPQSQPRLASDPNGITAVWTDGHAVFLGGLDRGAAQARPSRAIATGAVRFESLRVSRSADATLVLWTDPETLYAHVIPDHGPEAQLTLGKAAGAEVASDGNEWLVVAQELIDGRLQMRASVIAGGTVIAQELPLAISDAAQANIAVASRGTDFLVAWTEDHPDGRQLLALSVSSAGTPAGSVMDLAGGPIQGVQVAASGRLYLIVVQAPNIGFPVTSIVTDILVAGVPEGPFRVQPRADGFAVLHGSPLRATYVDALGNDTSGGELPIATTQSFDFRYDGPRLVVAHSVYDVGSQVVLDLFEPRVRALRR